jgi:hypothetical protein
MTARQIRRLMERRWSARGCVSPVYMARWVIRGRNLELFDEMFLVDEEEPTLD